MRKQLKRTLIIALAIFTLTSAACNNDQLKTIAKTVDTIALLIKDGAEIKDELVEQGTITQAEGDKIRQGLLKVNTALKVFNAKARTYAQAGGLTPAGKADLQKLATDIADAVSELVSNGTFGVKNSDAQVRINASVGALKQLTLTIINTVTLIKTKGA